MEAIVDEQTTGILNTRWRMLRTQAELTAAPDLVLHVLMQVVPGGGAGGAPVSGTKEVPLPLNVQALEDANGIYVGLMKWTMGHAARFRVQPPATALGYMRAEEPPTGFPSWATPADAHALTWALVDWLVGYEGRIAEIPSAHVYWEDVHELVSPVMKRWPVERRRPFTASRSCPVCARHTMIVDHDEERDEVMVACAFCGHTVPHKFRLQYLEWKEGAPWLSAS